MLVNYALKNPGSRCPVELRNLTYNCNVIGAFNNGTHPTKLRLPYMVIDVSKQCPQKTQDLVVRLNYAT